MIDSGNIKDWGIKNRNMALDAPRFDHTFETFRHDPVSSLRLGGAAAGSTGSRNILNFGRMGCFEQHVKGTQTIILPSLTDVGMDIGQDQTASDGIELTHGITNRSKHAYVIGTAKPFFFRVKAKVGDASGANPFIIGFRKAEAYQAVDTAYADYAAIGLIGTANPNTIKVRTEVAGAGNIDTDTLLTCADAATKEFRVDVAGNGKVTYSVNGVVVQGMPAYTFTAALVVVPYLYFLQAADVCDTLELIEWECGLVANPSKVRRFV